MDAGQKGSRNGRREGGGASYLGDEVDGVGADVAGRGVDARQDVGLDSHGRVVDAAQRRAFEGVPARGTRARRGVSERLHMGREKGRDRARRRGGYAALPYATFHRACSIR